MIKKAILCILIFTISINAVFAQDNLAANKDEVVFSRHTIGIDFTPLFGGLGLMGVLGFASAFIGFADIVSGEDTTELNNAPTGGGGIGLSYDYALNKHIVLGMNIDFMGANTPYMGMYYFTYNLGSKFFFDKNAVTPKGFYLEASIVGTYINLNNPSGSSEHIYAMGATAGLGGRLIFSRPSSKVKLGMDIGLGVGYQYALLFQNPDDRHLPAGYGTLSFNVGF